MVSTALAQQLKDAGLQWQPQLHDFFMVPEVGMEDRVFVVSDLMAQVEVLHGWPAITFVGAVEWALDYVLRDDALWLPSDDQLRGLLLTELGDSAEFTLRTDPIGCTCIIETGEATLTFDGASAGDAYARALLAVMG